MYSVQYVLSLGLLLGRTVYAWIFMYFRLKILRLLAFGWKSIFENTWGGHMCFDCRPLVQEKNLL